MDQNLKIILSGGGTMGSVVPLLAVRDIMLAQGQKVEFLWVGTEAGVEKELISKEMNFKSIQSGKLRRYFSWQNFLDPLRLIIGIFQSLALIRSFRPNLITVAFDSLLKSFDPNKVRLVGNPVRPRMLAGDKARGMTIFNLIPELTTLVVMGGSLGAEKINELLFQAIPSLIESCQIIHVVGKGKMVEWSDKEKFGELAKRYHPYEYVNQEMPDLYAVADLIVCRAGLATLSELSALKKPAIIIPIPRNQQVANADYFAKQNAVILLNQESVTSEEFIETVLGLLSSAGSLSNLSRRISEVMIADAGEKFVEVVKKIVQP